MSSEHTPVVTNHAELARPVPWERGVVVILGAVSTVLVVASGLLYLKMLDTQWADDIWLWLFQKVDMAGEGNIAATWGAWVWGILALSAALVGFLAQRKRVSWFLLAFIAIYAGFDEATMIHEEFYRFSNLVQSYLPTELFSYSWVMVGVVVAAVFIALLLPLVLALPTRSLVGLMLGGAIFLTGAVVMETVGGHIESHFGQVTWHLMLAIQIEEFFEYLGVIVVIWAVLRMVVVARDDSGYRVSFRGYRRKRTLPRSTSASSAHRSLLGLRPLHRDS